MAGAWLVRLERAGNRLPDPATVFVIALALLAVISEVATASGWSVQRDETAITSASLLRSDGLWWLVSHAVENFVTFPPLGVVLVGMLGIGLAEKSGLLGRLIELVVAAVPGRAITPVVVGVGVLSSLGLDAGYVVLPPLAALTYRSLGRPPAAGIAAAFAGVSAGFSANLVPTALDPLLAGFTETGARLVDPDYRVAVTANWYFMAASTFVLSAVGWWVSIAVVEPRLATAGGTATTTAPASGTREDDSRALRVTGTVALTLAFVVAAAIFVPGAPLNGDGARFARWVEAMVPLIAIGFFVPGLVYGVATGTFANDRDVARALGGIMADLGPYIVLAFFAAQFISGFAYTHLGEMLAFSGGRALADLAIPRGLLLGAFVTVVMGANLVIGSASAKYAFIAPIFVPLFMQAGIAPEATQAAYRVGDSITNIITPLNPYMVIIVAQFMRFSPDRAGMGTVVATMLPYALAFALAWVPLFGLWLVFGLPLGPGAPIGLTGV